MAISGLRDSTTTLSAKQETSTQFSCKRFLESGLETETALIVIFLGRIRVSQRRDLDAGPLAYEATEPDRVLCQAELRWHETNPFLRVVKALLSGRV